MKRTLRAVGITLGSLALAAAYLFTCAPEVAMSATQMAGGIPGVCNLMGTCSVGLAMPSLNVGSSTGTVNAAGLQLQYSGGYTLFNAAAFGTNLFFDPLGQSVFLGPLSGSSGFANADLPLAVGPNGESVQGPMNIDGGVTALGVAANTVTSNGALAAGAAFYNGITMNGAGSTTSPYIAVQGLGTNVDLDLLPAGNGKIYSPNVFMSDAGMQLSTSDPMCFAPFPGGGYDALYFELNCAGISTTNFSFLGKQNATYFNVPSASGTMYFELANAQFLGSATNTLWSFMEPSVTLGYQAADAGFWGNGTFTSNIGVQNEIFLGPTGSTVFNAPSSGADTFTNQNTSAGSSITLGTGTIGGAYPYVLTQSALLMNTIGAVDAGYIFAVGNNGNGVIGVDWTGTIVAGDGVNPGVFNGITPNLPVGTMVYESNGAYMGVPTGGYAFAAPVDAGISVGGAYTFPLEPITAGWEELITQLQPGLTTASTQYGGHVFSQQTGAQFTRVTGYIRTAGSGTGNTTIVVQCGSLTSVAQVPCATSGLYSDGFDGGTNPFLQTSACAAPAQVNISTGALVGTCATMPTFTNVDVVGYPLSNSLYATFRSDGGTNGQYQAVYK